MNIFSEIRVNSVISSSLSLINPHSLFPSSPYLLLSLCLSLAHPPHIRYLHECNMMPICVVGKNIDEKRVYIYIFYKIFLEYV